MKTIITFRADDSERLVLLALVGIIVGVTLGLFAPEVMAGHDGVCHFTTTSDGIRYWSCS